MLISKKIHLKYLNKYKYLAIYIQVYSYNYY